MAEAALSLEFSPEVVLVPDLKGDLLIRHRAARFIGQSIVGREVELNDGQPRHSLLDGLNQAVSGDHQARKMVEANVMSDVLERTIKCGFVTDKVHLSLEEDGSLSQHGQGYLSVQANSLAQARSHPIMLERTKAESRNAFRLEDLARQNLFEDYSMVVFSMAEDLADCGFYTDTMTCAIQVTAKDGDGIATESAFVAGRDPNGLNQDQATVSAIYRQLANEDIRGLSRAEIIDLPLLVPNNLIPNGVVDLVRLYDQIKGGCFFGLNKPPTDYLAFRQECRQREASYKDITAKIINQLLAEVSNFQTPSQATARLNQLSQYYSVEKSVYDQTIDPKVFGQMAARHIAQAREALAKGIDHQTLRELERAQKTAVSSSCPTPFDRSDSTNELGQDKYGSLSFYCPKGHYNTRPRNWLIEKCQYCGVSVAC